MKPYGILLVLLNCLHGLFAQYAGWEHSGSFFVLTTPEGANLPGTASETNFPVLVRLNREFFPFQQAKARGEDIRFASSAGAPLAFQIEEWDASQGKASIWVRLPRIVGNARQEVRLFWGKPDAVSASDGKAVFNADNGYVSVFHMNEPVRDEVGTLVSKDTGTLAAAGIIGQGRHFAGGQGIFGGDRIPNYPSGGGSHSTEAWFRAERPNATVLGWGNEGGGRGTKVRMQLRSPPHLHVDSDFADVDAPRAVPLSAWVHVAHTYSAGQGRIYINGQLEAAASPALYIKSPARFWIGGWYHDYDFVGDIDEVRISHTARSADWIRLEFENQRPLPTLVGPLVGPRGPFSLSPSPATLSEGQRMTFSGTAGGAQKLYWVLVRDGTNRVVAVDQCSYTLDAGRVARDTSLFLQFQAVYTEGTQTGSIPVLIKKEIPEPAFSLHAPPTWNGRDTIEVAPVITNLAAMRAKGAGDLHYTWTVSGGAVIREIVPGKLILKRSQCGGTIGITLALNNGGADVIGTTSLQVTEPASDPWITRAPEKDEKPEDNQFYARDDQEGATLYYNGTLKEAADSVFLKVYAGDELFKAESQRLGVGRAYGFTVRLKAGLIKYSVQFGRRQGLVEQVLATVTNLVCGDAYLIDGQSNALATDTSEEAAPYASDWIRTYGNPPGRANGPRANLWCAGVWKAKGGRAELGYWGMELAKRLVESRKLPICILNGAVGGTRIDQHQRNPVDPEDLSTIYGRLLGRVRQARLTHGIRAILWHQGENDQGAAGPTGRYGWETYRDYFVELSAGWKQDYPNVQHYYLFQIWPNACAMGGQGSGDRLREVQRFLPSLYSRMDIMSTLGIKPGGGCHYPLAGWAEFARLMQPLLERDLYGQNFTAPITPPNLRRAAYAATEKNAITLEFDQPVLWSDSLTNQFYLDGAANEVTAGVVSGNVITLKLRAGTAAHRITYLRESSWNQDNLLFGANAIAALTFCDVPIAGGWYPPAGDRVKSPGKTAYFVDPVDGDDARSGLARDQAWRTFRPVNARVFAPGDAIEVLRGGSFLETLMPTGAGTEESPVSIHFSSGRYDFFPADALKLKLHISNTDDDPYTPKVVAVLFREARHFRVSGERTDFYFHGKMIEMMFDHAQDITFTGLTLDYHRPLVSEFTVQEVGTNFAIVRVQADCAYAIEGGHLVWVGEGWRSAGKGLNQECDPAEDGRTWRRGNGPLTGVTRVEELEPFRLRLAFERNPGLVKGHVIQFRETFRDCAGGLVQRSRNITWKNCAVHALGGMGIVHQFSENLTYDHVDFAPRPGSGRTTCGWADLLHFSGCRGQILVTDCKLSGSHDDPINVHGTHLRIVDRPAPDQVLVRFMHPQTYGLEAFVPGDDIEFVNHLSLRAYATNRVKSAVARGDKDILLTLAAPAPEKIGDGDVVENVTWTPSVIVRRCEVSVDSCRGFLLTTRRPVLVEDNTFLRTTMSAIDIADDANSWFESGPVRDVTIRGNRFIKCGEPVIRIMPENRLAEPGEPVHQHIRILENWFDLTGKDAVSAKSTQGLVVRGNRFSSAELPVHTRACTEVSIEDNQLGAKP